MLGVSGHPGHPPTAGPGPSVACVRLPGASSATAATASLRTSASVSRKRAGHGLAQVGPLDPKHVVPMVIPFDISDTPSDP